MKPTKKQLERRKKSFSFRGENRESWFYIDSNVPHCSFHQKGPNGTASVFGLRATQLIKALKACGYIAVFLMLIVTPSYAAQVCTDAQEFQFFALSHKAKSAEIDNLSKQTKLYVANVANYKEQNNLLKKEIGLLQESVTEQKKLSASCEVLIDEHKKVLADALAALDEATRESWIEKGAYLGTGFALGVVARWGWMKWVRR